MIFRGTNNIQKVISADRRLVTLTFILGDILHLFTKKNKFYKYSGKEAMITVRQSVY